MYVKYTLNLNSNDKRIKWGTIYYQNWSSTTQNLDYKKNTFNKLIYKPDFLRTMLNVIRLIQFSINMRFYAHVLKVENWKPHVNTSSE